MGTKSCGGGSQSRSRSITEPTFGGDACPHSAETRGCNPQPCPEDCRWEGEWDAWTTCTKSCRNGNGAKGSQQRSRIFVLPKFGGKTCTPYKETRHCNTHLCPVDCEVSQWSKWGACSVVCGPGIKARTRGVVKSARHGGKRCPDLVDEQDCQGAAGHCPIDCVFEWKPWTQCSA